jgi:cytidine deaminase
MKDDLIACATAARERAIAPYSNFKVGAAVRSKSGRIYDGCNIENVSFGLTVCAERVALLKALSEGEREFSEIAVVTDTQQVTPPCGSCRQLLWEYCGDIHVRLHTTSGKEETHALSALLPHPFDITHL